MEGFDELWPGGPRFRQGGFRLSTDSVLLAAFAAGIPARRIMDLGCGAGVLTVLLSASHPDAAVRGIEIQEKSAEMCRANMAENGFGAENIICGDLRRHRETLRAGEFDLVVSNPPYFPVGSGGAAPDDERACARDERCCTLTDVCTAAAYLCRWGGSFAMVHRPERLAEIFCTLRGVGLEPKRLRMVQYAAGSAPNLVLVESRRGGKPGLAVEPPLLLTENGTDSAEAAQIYHRGR